MGVTYGITKRPGTNRDRGKTKTPPAVAEHFINIPDSESRGQGEIKD